jgi:hypothetical protein
MSANLLPIVLIIFVGLLIVGAYYLGMAIGKVCGEGRVEYVAQHYGAEKETFPHEGFSIMPLNIPSGRGYFETNMGLLVKDNILYIKILEPESLNKIILSIPLNELQRSIYYGMLSDSLSLGFPKCPGVVFWIPLKYRHLIPSALRAGVDYAA